MNRAMFSGVAGLKTHQTKMDVIGNNIANVNTYGYKAQRAVFADLMYQNLRGASAGSANKGGTSPSSVGYGSSLAGIQTQMTQSSMQSTGFGLDVAITGEGFLQVMDGDGNIFYTKAGMLDYDSQGYLTDINGNFVLGTTEKDGKPGTQKIRLDNIGSVDAKKPVSEMEINGVKYKIEASNATKYGNVGITLNSSTELPAGMKAQAVISSTGAILVSLNAYETFNSMTELNNAVNAAITEANGGKPHAAGTFTISADKNMFGKDAAGGTFTGKAFDTKGQLTGATNAAGNVKVFGNIAEITDFSKISKWVDGKIDFKVDQKDADNLTIETTIDGVKYSGSVGKTAKQGATIELKAEAPATGSISMKLSDGGGGGTALDALRTVGGGTATDSTVTAAAPVSFLGGASITSMGSNFSGSGKITFDLTGTPLKMTATTEDGSVYSADFPEAGGSVVLQKYDASVPPVAYPNDTITMNIPSFANIKKALGLAENAVITDAPTLQKLKDTLPNQDYKATPATEAITSGLTGAQIAGAAGGVEAGKLDFGNAKLFGGAMTFMKASAGFTGDGKVTDFTATYVPADATKGTKEAWNLVMNIGGKVYKSTISEDTAASSILLKASDDDYVQMSNPGFTAIKDYYKQMNGGADPMQGTDSVNAISGGDITAKPSEKSKNLGLGTNFTLEGGTEGGAITLDQLSSISIGSDGTVSVSHPDKGVVVAGKISLANFANASGLQLAGNNYFTASANSGEPKLCDPGSDGTGALKSSALEMSNVDLSGEFADMITTQRGFQANSRIITVSDTMLEELINLKR